MPLKYFSRNKQMVRPTEQMISAFIILFNFSNCGVKKEKLRRGRTEGSQSSALRQCVNLVGY